MTILIQHAKQYVNKNCERGFCQNKKSATLFSSIFMAMKYLCSQRITSIKEYKFIETQNQTKDGYHEQPKINTNGRRRRTV